MEDSVCQDISFTGTCVVDDAIDRVLTGAYHIFDSSPFMTKEICHDWCKDNGDFDLFGLENGNQCFCGNDFRYPLEIVHPGECHVPCPGDEAETCGGYYRMNLWSMHNAMPSYSFLETDGDWTFVSGGCYEDEGNEPILRGYHYPSDSMTREKCRNLCKNADYEYSSLRNGNTCSCGHKLHPANPVLADNPAVSCNLPCTGNPEEICGGEAYSNVFHTKTDPVE